MANLGRAFEKEIKNSCEKQGIFCHKIADTYIPAKAITENVFVPEQPADFVVAYNGFTWFMEAKSTKEKYITFAREQKDKGMLHFHQWTSLLKFDEYDEVKCGLLVRFEDDSEKPKTYYWPIKGFLAFLQESSKKSFNAVNVVQNKGIVIEQQKLRTHWSYNMKDLFSNPTI